MDNKNVLKVKKTEVLISSENSAHRLIFSKCNKKGGIRFSDCLLPTLTRNWLSSLSEAFRLRHRPGGIEKIQNDSGRK